MQKDPATRQLQNPNLTPLAAFVAAPLFTACLVLAVENAGKPTFDKNVSHYFCAAVNETLKQDWSPVIGFTGSIPSLPYCTAGEQRTAAFLKPEFSRDTNIAHYQCTRPGAKVTQELFLGNAYAPPYCANSLGWFSYATPATLEPGIK